MKSFKFEFIIVLLLLIVSKTFSQTNLTAESPQYLFKSFSAGNILMKNNKIHPTVMNYNTVTENMVFEQNGELLNLTNLDKIDTVYLQNTKFIPMDKSFYEVISITPLPLFIQHKGKLSSPRKTIGYGASSAVASTTNISSIESSGSNYNLPLSNEYIVKLTPLYWLILDGEMVSFSNTKQLQKLFPKRGNEIKKIIKKGKLKLYNRDDLVEIIRFCAGDDK